MEQSWELDSLYYIINCTRFFELSFCNIGALLEWSSLYSAKTPKF